MRNASLLRLLPFLAGVALACALPGCKSKGTFVHVVIQPGSAEPSGILSLEVRLTLGDKTATVTLQGSGGGALTFPTDATFEIGSGAGQLAITAIARGAGGLEIDRGTTTAVVTTGAITEATLQLAGGKPDLQPAEATHGFAGVKAGTAGAAETISFRNAGFKPTGTLSTALGGVGAASFAIKTDNCSGASLAPQTSCTVLVAFNPSALDPAAATLTVSSGPGGAATTALTGTGLPNPQTLSATILSGGGSDGTGSITSQPAGLVCSSGACTHDFPFNAVVQLSATPGTGSRFVAWGGACSGSGACSVTMSLARAVTASFALNAQRLSVTVTPGAGGAVVSALPDASLSCTGTALCTKDYSYGTNVTLNAVPATGFGLTSWSGACTGSAPACQVTMTADRSVTATFGLLPEVLSASVSGLGSLSSVPAGITTCSSASSTPCTATFDYGTSVTLTAKPGTGWLLGSWTTTGTSPGADCVSGSATCTIPLTAAASVSHAFVPSQQQLTVQVSGAGQGTVSLQNRNGVSTTCSAGTGCTLVYDYGTVVSLSATPGTGSLLSSWGGACSGSAACQVTMTQAQTVSATFGLVPETLTINNSGSGSGLVTYPLPGGGSATCSAPTCTVNYPYGTQITLTSAASSGSRPAGWTGACSGPGDCPLTMTTPRTVTANWVKQQVLALTLSGAGSVGYAAGPITGTCNTSCSLPFDVGTPVTLTENPVSGSSFSSWGGACSGAAATCQVTLSADRSVSATFAALPEPVSVSVSGLGQVSSSPAGILNCSSPSSSPCTASFLYGTSVVFTASPGSGWLAGKWTGSGSTPGADCVDGSSTCTVLISAATTVSHAFAPTQQTLTVQVKGSGAGTVSYLDRNGTAATCTTASCVLTYDYGTAVSFTATPGTGSSLSAWGGACSGVAVCQVTMTAAQTVSATFDLKPVKLTLTGSGTGSGSVSYKDASGTTVSCSTATCTTTYSYGQQVTLTAAAGATSRFGGWGGACSGTASACTLTLTADTTASASFVQQQVLMLSAPSNGSLTWSGGGQSGTCPSCSATFDQGTAVTITANPASGYQLNSWSGACSGSTSPCQVTMTGPLTVGATFGLTPVAVTVNISGTAGTATSSPSGISGCSSAGGAQCSTTFAPGTQVTLTAAPAAGSQVASWSVLGFASVTSGCTNGSSPSPGSATCVFTPTGNTQVSLTFGVQQVPLTIGYTGPGAGTFSYTPPSGSTQLSCGAASGCTTYYNYAAGPITITANPISGSSFAVWSGCPSFSGNICTINSLTAATSVTAKFQTSLQTQLTGTGGGTVASDVGGVSCSTTCTTVFSSALAIVLTATPGAGSAFTGWGGDCASFGTSKCNLTMDQGHSVIANFAPTHVLSTKKYFDGTSSASGGDYTWAGASGGLCAAGSCAGLTNTVVEGTTQTLTAVPASGYLFQGWTGACSGSSRTCTVTMTAAAGDQTANANFITNFYNVFFVSSAKYIPNLGSAAAYDNKCNQLASAAGLNPNGNGFVAFLSDDVAASPRSMSALLGGVSGSFVRVDGQPVVLQSGDLFNGAPKVLTPLNLTENGNTVAQNTWILTGTSNSGASTGNTCSSYTDASNTALATVGLAWAGPGALSSFGVSCSNFPTWNIYCVEKDRSGPIYSMPTAKPAGSKYFYTAPFVTGSSSGPTSADDACNASTLYKPAGTGPALALVATTTQSAAARAFPKTSLLDTLYVRGDNLAVGLGREIVAGTLRTNAWHSYSGRGGVWTGADTPSQVGTTASTCNDWNPGTANLSSVLGTVTMADSQFFRSSSGSQCSTSNTYLVYCVEQ